MGVLSVAFSVCFKGAIAYGREVTEDLMKLVTREGKLEEDEASLVIYVVGGCKVCAGYGEDAGVCEFVEWAMNGTLKRDEGDLAYLCNYVMCVL